MKLCEIIMDKLFPCHDSIYKGFSRDQFFRLLKNCVQNNFFLFNGAIYEQVDGCFMGGCVSPTLENAFLCHHEATWLENCPVEFKPAFYRRYVDDCFILFHQPSHAEKFYEYLNKQHERIQFTYETETSNGLPFLDTFVSKCGSIFRTSSYRKPTNTGLGLKYNSAVSYEYKMNLIDCLVDRAYKINTTLQGLLNELDFLRRYFTQNGYSVFVVMRNMAKKMENLKNPAPVIHSVSKRIIYCKIPFISNIHNKNLKTDIINLGKEYFPHVNIRLIFSNKFTIGQLFPFKDKIPASVRGNVVYKYQCRICDSTYIGETTRHYSTRVSEHRAVSPRTGAPLQKTNSNMYNHFLETGHFICEEDFCIIGSQLAGDLRTAESIFIHSQKPNLNNMTSSVELNIL